MAAFPLPHPLYYNQEGNVVIKAGDTLFRLNDDALSALPYNFTKFLGEPINLWTLNGGDRFNNARPLRLPVCIEARHFERYLWVYYPVPGAPAVHQMKANDWFRFLKCFLVLQAGIERPSEPAFKEWVQRKLSRLSAINFDSFSRV